MINSVFQSEHVGTIVLNSQPVSHEDSGNPREAGSQANSVAASVNLLGFI